MEVGETWGAEQGVPLERESLSQELTIGYSAKSPRSYDAVELHSKRSSLLVRHSRFAVRSSSGGCKVRLMKAPAGSSDASSMRTGLIDVAVLDDDSDFLHYIEDFLKDERLYTVRTFSHPDDLYLSCDQDKPDIVLLDMKMGPFHGETVLEEIQTRHPDLCIIIVTGYPSLEDMRITFKRKVFDYLAKPFSLSQLRQTLRNAIEAHDLGRTPQDRLRGALGHRLKMLRVERNWSLKDLATQTGVSVSQLSSIERGAHMPSIESLLSLCHAFSLKPSELLASIDF